MAQRIPIALCSLLLVGRLLAGPAGSAEGLAPDQLKPLEKAARELAKGGRGGELDAVLTLLREAGQPADAHAKLAATLRADAAKVKKPAATLPSTAKTLQKCAADLAARLDAEPDEAARVALARFIVRIDGENAAAQAALGRSKAGGDWLDAVAKGRRDRASKLAAALAAARRLDVPIDTGKSVNRLFTPEQAARASWARLQGTSVHGCWPVEKLTRVLREAARACAVDSFLLTDTLAVPKLEPYTFVLFDQRADYLAAVERVLAAGMLDKQHAADAQELAAVFAGNTYIGWDIAEVDVSAALHTYFTDSGGFAGAAGVDLRDLQSGVVAALENWTALAYLGARLPVFAVEEEKETRRNSGRTASITESELLLRERMLLLSEAGLAGGRAWIQYLAARREDPPFENALVDQMGRLQGPDLQKATFVVEMWLEDGPFLARLKKMPEAKRGAAPVASVEAAIGKPLPAIEAEWREWIAGSARGLAETLAAPAAESEPPVPGMDLALKELNALRERARVGSPPVDGDSEASRKCGKHVAYLLQNPDQLARWPDAHEEYADHPGFDPEGAWAGMHSVIAPGVADAKEAIAGWMGTFYHRLPLLDAGLVRIGYAQGQRLAVLDSGSFVRPAEVRKSDSEHHSAGYSHYWGIAWPPNEARDVPTHFVPELPNPVPDTDQPRFGYPITYQLRWAFGDRPELELELHSGSATGSRIDCHFSTPTAPTNPQLAPDRCWCLIPKEPLQPTATYFVTARLTLASQSLDDRFSWSFKTGR